MYLKKKSGQAFLHFQNAPSKEYRDILHCDAVGRLFLTKLHASDTASIVWMPVNDLKGARVHYIIIQVLLK